MTFLWQPGDDVRPLLRSVSRSHVGRVRAINEDRIFDDPRHALWAVADGMGGHRGGEAAAQVVIDALRAATLEPTLATGGRMQAALEEANATILARNARLGLEAGATVVAAAGSGPSVDIAWSGDSRAYLIGGGQARQLTRDHSLVQELVDAGLIDAAGAAGHPQANVVTRALGVRTDAQLDSVTIEVGPAKRLLLCSDGLSRSLRPGDFADPLPLAALADRLLANALARDGHDNISLVLIEFGSR